MRGRCRVPRKDRDVVRGEAAHNAGLPQRAARTTSSQQLASIVRLSRNADKQWGAVVAREAERERKRDVEFAAAAPARAAQNKRKCERERAIYV